MVAGNEGLNCRMIGRFKGGSPYSTGRMKEKMATVDKMSTVVIEYLEYSKVSVKHKKR
jgi:hypothetical protein